MDPSRNLDETGDLLLRDGKIAAVGGELSAEDARVVHADGLIAAPGLVDMHVHLRDPGQTHKERYLLRLPCGGGWRCDECARDAQHDPRHGLRGGGFRYPAPRRGEADAARLYCGGDYERAQKRGTGPICAHCAVRARSLFPTTAGRSRIPDSWRDAMILGDEIGLKVVAHCEDLFLAKGGLMNEGVVSHKLGIQGDPRGRGGLRHSEGDCAGGGIRRAGAHLPCQHGDVGRDDP